MHLTSLELIGFKSFAKRTTLQFEPGVTAIVGPNGSGKSNIADAIRWVLGAQSKKAVRGKVSTDVIFSGTGSKAAMSLAEVSLTFDNSDGKLPYDFTEVVVTRRLYRSGESEYLVNGSTVRLTDLQHAMAVAGIGAENYTVISQGMVDRALSQSPRERRGLFEEAAGVRQFYLKRDDARRKLTETTTNLSRVEDIVRELSPRLKTLKRQASALAQAEDTKAKLQSAYLAKYGHAFRELDAELGERRGKRDELDKEFLALQQELERAAAELTEMRERQQGMKLNKMLAARDELRNQREEWQNELNQAITNKEVAAAKETSLTQAKEQFASRLAELKGQAPEDESPVTDPSLAKDIAVLGKKLGELEKTYQDLRTSLEKPAGKNNLKEFSDELGQTVAALTKAVEAGEPLTALKAHLTKLQELVAGARVLAGEPAEDQGILAQTSKVLAERDQVMGELQQLRLQQAAYEQAVTARAEAASRHDREISALAGQVKGMAEELSLAAKTVEKEKAHIDELSEKLSGQEKAYAKLEKEINEEQQQSLGDVSELQALEKTVEDKRRTQEAYRQELSEANIELAKLETRLEGLVTEAKAKLEGQFPPDRETELPALATDQDQAIERLERRLLELGGIDPAVTAEHDEVNERFEFLSHQAEDLHKAKADLEKVISQLERKSQTLFREAFAAINQEFGHYFSKLFGGGKAELKLIEEKEDEAEEAPSQFGIDISATPPGKRLQNLTMLSGGERALTSVALLFAILKVNPSPFVMLDEVDAALDEANTGRFAELVQAMSDQTQFVVVTHNRDTMKAAQQLYGVTMDETGISTMLSLKLPEAEKMAAAA